MLGEQGWGKSLNRILLLEDHYEEMTRVSAAVVREALAVEFAILLPLPRHRLLQWRTLESPPKVLRPNSAQLRDGKKKHRGADPGRRQLPAGGAEENGRSGDTPGWHPSYLWAPEFGLNRNSWRPLALPMVGTVLLGVDGQEDM